MNRQEIRVNIERLTRRMFMLETLSNNAGDVLHDEANTVYREWARERERLWELYVHPSTSDGD